MPESELPVTKDRVLTGFPDRSPETKNAEDKMTYLCERGASILCYCLSEELRPKTMSSCSTINDKTYNCGQCDVCTAVDQCSIGMPPEHLQHVASEFEVTTVKGGITNLMLHIKHPSIDEKALRIFGLGSEHIIDRPRERLIVEYLSGYGIGKRVHERYISSISNSQGQIEEWIEGRSLSPEQMRVTDISHKIAQRVAYLHTIPVPDFLEKDPRINRGSSSTILSRISAPHVQKVYDWLDQAQSLIDADHRFNDLKVMNFKVIKEYVDHIVNMDKILAQTPDRLFNNEQRLVHGDLLSGNIVLQCSGNIRFIDFEYTDVGVTSYDLANHFNECTGFECSEADYDKYYPDEETQRTFIKVYIDEICRLKGIELSYDEILEQNQRVYDEVQVNVLISHFYWGAWALNKALWQSTEKQIEFDFKTYAFQRLSAGLSWAFSSKITHLAEY